MDIEMQVAVWSSTPPCYFLESSAAWPPSSGSDSDVRVNKYWAVAKRKRSSVLAQRGREDYYNESLRLFALRTDDAAVKDRVQLGKDLPRTFGALPPVKGGFGESAALLPLLWNIVTAYIQRGRALSVTFLGAGEEKQVCSSMSGESAQAPSTASTMLDCGAGGAATTARGLLAGYPQGLNFLAGMSLLCVGAAAWAGESSKQASLEEAAFWLLAALLEDVMDPDFFGADVRGNLQMAYVGGLGMRNLIMDLAEERCPATIGALGPEAFRSSLFAVLDQWVLSLFVGCVPPELLDELWDRLVLQSHDDFNESVDNCRRIPCGLATIAAFALAALDCCGERVLAESEVLRRLKQERLSGATPEMLSLQAAEAIQGIRTELLKWPRDKDSTFLERVDALTGEVLRTCGGYAGLWDDVRLQKQMIVDCTEDYDKQLMSLAVRTHFTIQEIARLNTEFKILQDGLVHLQPAADLETRPQSREEVRLSGLSLEVFSEVMRKVVPEFPLELCARLFKKLDAFGVGRIAFAELACGMSALSLGTMDEKLQVCFDMFDSEGRRALTLKDLCELCTVLFRIAHCRGLPAAQVAVTDEVLLSSSLGRSGCDSPQQSTLRGSEPGSERQRRTLPTKPSTFQHAAGVGCTQDFFDFEEHAAPPWRSMLLRLLAAAQVHSPDGKWLVAFEDFRRAAYMEPALLFLFSWCLPRPPQSSEPELGLGTVIEVAGRSTSWSCCSRLQQRLSRCLALFRGDPRRDRRDLLAQETARQLL